MTNNAKTVIVLSREQSIYNQLEDGLNGFSVATVETVETLNEIAASAYKMGAFVLEIKSSHDWTAFEFVRTGYQSVPCFVLLDGNRDGYESDKDKATSKGAMAVFPIDNTAPLVALIRSSAHNNLRRGADLDQNSDFLSVYGDISRELGRLQNEFTETSLRTLPQPFIGEDTKSRLRANLSRLQDITITP